MKRFGLVLAVLGLVACGGDDGDGGGSSGGGSFGAISQAIAMPTGTVDMATAPSIAEEYEAIQSGSAGGERFEQNNQTITMACASSGEIVTMVSGNQNAAQSTFTYNDCCQTAGCCLNGDGTSYFSTSGGESEYSICAEYAITATCGGEPSNVSYEGCLNASGAWTYVVRVDGDTYAVSGSYSGGNGTLEIRGANGNYTCTYTNGTGSCSGDGSFSF